MSDFKFSCPGCGQSIVCDTSNAGMQIPCPTCQKVLTVPAPPPVVQAAPAPGKLSISKSVASHHPAPPPPGAANAPAKPTWGAKPAAAPPPKKAFPWVAVSVVAVLLIAGAVGWFGFGAPYLKQKAEKEKQAQEEADRQAKEAKAQADAEAARILRAKNAGWTLDMADAQFPDRHASGKLHGNEFNVDSVSFQNGFLILRQTSGSPGQFQIGLQLKAGERLPGQSFQIDPAGTNPVPRVAINWKEESPKPPGSQVFAKGYLLKLEFGEPGNGGVPGKIYLCLPDDSQSYVAGRIEIVRKTGGPQPNAGQPPPNKPRRKKEPPPPQ